MNTEHLTEVEIAGRRLTVPVFKDSLSTQRIAARVTAKIEQIEKKSRRIDTHAFALQAAYSFASLLAASKETTDGDEKELLVTLDEITQTLYKILDEFSPDDEKPSPERPTKSRRQALG